MFVPDFNFKMKHRHLDGDRSLTQVMPELHRLTYGHTRPYPFNPWARHQEQIAERFLQGGIHKDIVRKFSVTTGIMQNPASIFTAVENFILINGRRGFEGEFIAAPQYHVFGDRQCEKGRLNEKWVAEIMIAAIKEGEEKLRKETGRKIRFRMMFGIGREVSSEEAVRLVRIMLECDPDYIPGISLVCHEPNAPPEKFVDAFRLAKSEGRKTACHVEWVKDREEWEKDTPDKIRANFQEDLPQLTQNLETAIHLLGVDQIDHGFGLAENPELIKVVADKGIVVTVCPGSLLATHLIDNIKMLKTRELLDAGITVVIDVDDDLFMRPMNEIIQLYVDAYRTPSSAENLDRLKADLAKLANNSKLAQF
ncbi:MAG: hypothetical protein A3J46_01085 [Candidatus Yanofskybacteria bacterium RIFCSPHIGHO2_02_FULL_41_11]|uniref:Adenosine deaminase domain-containing protein n=1 Tax=Candidatus Yanofskybacteria bacterium RIFCSPHIGHO2_02_FULL_41_11 TaxID=1802675 RepID=A0A1F8F4Z1_9BACT|nr:MAG: hypothetical protein A3J46_01085 [Candidatus Yanofskybacteria bacterium RIFCSPHIGHO2_02_FULL_41_11]